MWLDCIGCLIIEMLDCTWKCTFSILCGVYLPFQVVYLPSPLRQLDLIVVGPTSENADSDISSMYGDISQTISGVRRAFTLTNPDGVTGVIPSQFGDFSPIDVCELRSNSRYLIFTRTEYFMDVSGRVHHYRCFGKNEINSLIFPPLFQIETHTCKHTHMQTHTHTHTHTRTHTHTHTHTYLRVLKRMLSSVHPLM